MSGGLLTYINSVIPYCTCFTYSLKREEKLSHILLFHKPKWVSKYPAGFFLWLILTVKLLQGIPANRARGGEKSAPHGQQERRVFIWTSRADGCAGSSSAGRAGHLESHCWKWTWREYLPYKYLDMRASSSWRPEMILIYCGPTKILGLFVIQLSEMEETRNLCTSYLIQSGENCFENVLFS